MKQAGLSVLLQQSFMHPEISIPRNLYPYLSGLKIWNLLLNNMEVYCVNVPGLQTNY